MLKGLNRIDWQNIPALFEPGANVPVWLNEMVSDDLATAKVAFEWLSANAEHQGTVGAISVEIVPFLLEIVSRPSAHNRVEILQFLYKLTNLWAWERENSSHYPVGSDFVGKPQETANDFYIQQIYQSLRQAQSVLLALLKDTEPQIRRESISILALFVEDSDEIVPKLLDYASTEDEVDTRAAAIWYAGNLIYVRNFKSSQPSEYIATYRKWVEPFVLQKDNNVLTLAAAIGYAKVVKVQAVSDVDSKLIFAIENSEQLSTLPWRSDLVSDISIAMLCLGYQRARSLLMQALQKVPTTVDAHVIASALLALVIEGKTKHVWPPCSVRYGFGVDDKPEIEYSKWPAVLSDRSTLSRDQKIAVDAIFRCDKFWEIRNNLLGVFGLPVSREELRQMLT